MSFACYIRLNKLPYIDNNKENQLLYEKAFKNRAKTQQMKKLQSFKSHIFHWQKKCVLSFAKINVKPDLGAF